MDGCSVQCRSGLGEVGDELGMSVDEATSVPSRPTCIEALPPELLLYLSRFLDLASTVVLSTATCRSLRAIFAQFDRELLYLEPGHRLCLAEWRQAAEQLREHTQPQHSEPQVNVRVSSVNASGKVAPPVDSDISRMVHELTRDDSLIDLDLFKAVLDFLSCGSPTERARDIHAELMPFQGLAGMHAGGNKVVSLHLTGWHGIAGAFLIQQLRMQPALRSVRTVVKTERADNRIWQQVAAEQQTLVPPSFWPAPVLDTDERGRSGQPGFVRCTSTQIIMQVGRRRPRREGQAYLRGEGLQMGYEGYCIDLTPTPGHTTNQHAPIGSATPENAPARSLPSASDESAPTGERLHIILQGREDTDAALGGWEHNEQLWVRSIVTCNHCKAPVKF